MTSLDIGTAINCPRCPPDAADFRVVSRHRTSEGVTTWVRCRCGFLCVVADVDGSIISASGHSHSAW
jgi:hypothetical protein